MCWSGISGVIREVKSMTSTAIIQQMSDTKKEKATKKRKKTTQKKNTMFPDFI
jgi:hypothetical protein